MTTIIPQTITCSFCHTPSEQNLIGSTNSFGAPDLDTRPPEMMRSTMPLWVQECPHCGYVAKDLAQPPHASAASFAGEGGWHGYFHYREYPELAQRFLKLSDIQEAEGHLFEAAWSSLRAAWVCDDARNATLAVATRQRALGFFVRGRVGLNVFPKEPGAEQALYADICRRSGDFDGAIHWADEGLERDPDTAIAAVLHFQRSKAMQHDLGCYKGTDV